MRTLKLVFAWLGSIVVVAGCVAYYFNDVVTEKDKNNESLMQVNQQLSEELELLTTKLRAAELKYEEQNHLLLSLKRDFGNDNKSPNNINTSVASASNVPVQNAHESANKNESLSTSPLLAMANRIKNGTSLKDVENNMRLRFAKEQVDESWAYEYEDNIRELVASDEENRFDIQNIECKSSACELKLTATESNSMIIGTLFAKTLSEQQWRDKEATLMFNHQVTDGVISILIGREKNSFN